MVVVKIDKTTRKFQQPMIKGDVQQTAHAPVFTRFGTGDDHLQIGHSRNSRKQFFFQGSRD